MGLRRPRVSPVWAWIAALAAAAVALYATELAGLGAAFEHPRLEWWVLAVIFCLAESFPVHLDFRSETHSLSLSELGIVLGLFFATPTSLLAGFVIGAGVALVFVRRQRPLKVAFNLAEFTLSTGIAVVVFRAIAGLGDPHGPAGWLAAVAGAAAFGLVSVVLVAATITLAAGGAPWRELPTTVGLGLVGSLASASLALAAVVMLEADTRSVWLLVVPAACWALAFRAYGQQRKRHEHVQFLYQTMRATQGAPELRTAVRELLLAARAMVSAEYAAILLVDASSDQALHSVVSPASELLMEPVLPTAAAQRMIGSVSGRDSTLLLPRGRGRHAADEYLAELGLDDAIVMSLRREHTVFGVLVVGNRLGDVSTFNADDRTLLETFAGHASVLLENDRVKEQLRYQAFHDALTGLPNRALFAERVRGALAERANRTIVLFVDLDDFKSVNDTLGHTAGDELLAAVAERVRACLRPGDTAARLGGDEFGVLLEGAFDDDAAEIAGRLVDAMRAPFSLHGREAHVHASIGIASGASGAATADELLMQADVAMYSAKAAGKRQYATYEPQMHARIRGRHDLAASLEVALERDEICVYFQPIVTLSDRRTVAFEALVRWLHPTRGLLAPDTFLPLAEERGLMPEIGRAVLRTACATTARWQQLPGCGGLRVAVNLSPGELLRPEVVDDVAVALSESGLPSGSLVLEITESGAMSDRTGAVAALHALRQLGVGLALDDFGTGHASLSHLRDFPIDMLKIAKTFVDRLERGASDVTFVDAILRLAATLELSVVAEGIERAEQAELLRRLDCGLGQGFHFARPLSPDDAEAQLVETLAQHQRRRIRVA
jgi:diguanylate cyclase (GGDEF)-like protein